MRSVITIGMSLFLTFLLSACGNLNAALTPPPFFSAYSSSSIIKFGETQILQFGVMTKIDANFLYFGDPNSFHAETSSFQPVVPGLYLIDEQLYVEGTYTEQYIRLRTQLNYNDAMYLYYDNVFSVPPGQPVVQSGRVQSLICFTAPTDHVEASTLLTCNSGNPNCGHDISIRSHLSQFEGHYVGECLGHN